MPVAGKRGGVVRASATRVGTRRGCLRQLLRIKHRPVGQAIWPFGCAMRVCSVWVWPKQIHKDAAAAAAVAASAVAVAKCATLS